MKTITAKTTIELTPTDVKNILLNWARDNKLNVNTVAFEVKDRGRMVNDGRGGEWIPNLAVTKVTLKA